MRAVFVLLLVIIGCSDEVQVEPPPPTDVCPDDCDDGDSCSEDRCMATGCVHLATIDGAPCTSSKVPNGTCSEGRCTCTADEQCDDGNPATQDNCILMSCHHE